jgi:hypothetical protein
VRVTNVVLSRMSSMKAPHRSFPPQRLADLTKQSAANFFKLIGRLEHGITLVLGAGVSSSVGIPFWSQLLERMCSGFFEHWQFDIGLGRSTPEKPPSDMSIAFAQYEYHSEQARHFGKRLASKDLLLAAQQIKNCVRDIDLLYLLRHSLYDPIQYTPCTSSLIESLGRLCSSGGSPIKSVISYNYDDLIAHALANQRVRHQLMYEGGHRLDEQSGLPIYFVHGVLPIKGGFSSRIVLAESDYQQESASPYAWGNQIQLQHFSQRSCVFIGNSMTDPNARRLLRLARSTSSCPHFYFVPSSSDIEDGLFESLFDYDLSRLQVLPIRFPKQESSDPYERLPQLIDLLREATVDASVLWQ